MRKCFLCLLAALLAVAASAQTTAEQYKARYDLLVSRLGVTGLGVETALDKWETAYPDDIDMLCGRFLYKLGKSARNEVVRKDRPRFMGKEPMLTLKDSLDRPVYYYEEAFYDDELFGQALKYIDRAVALAPERLDIRLSRITALMAYEKESPDMTPDNSAASSTTISPPVPPGCIRAWRRSILRCSTPSSRNTAPLFFATGCPRPMPLADNQSVTCMTPLPKAS